MARQITQIKFSEADKARMHELAKRNQAGTLTDEEREELDNFVNVGDYIAILQSKARKILKKAAK